MPGPEPTSQDNGDLKLLRVCQAILKLAPRDGDTSAGKSMVGKTAVLITRANKAMAKNSMGRNSQLKLNTSLLEMPKIRMTEELIKSTSQAVWKLTASNTSKDRAINSQTKPLTSFDLETKMTLAAKGKTVARKMAKELTEPMVLNEVDLLKSKGNGNFPNKWGRAIMETNNPETAKTKIKPKMSSGFLNKLLTKK